MEISWFLICHNIIVVFFVTGWHGGAYLCGVWPPVRWQSCSVPPHHRRSQKAILFVLWARGRLSPADAAARCCNTSDSGCGCDGGGGATVAFGQWNCADRGWWGQLLRGVCCGGGVHSPQGSVVRFRDRLFSVAGGWGWRHPPGRVSPAPACHSRHSLTSPCRGECSSCGVGTKDGCRRGVHFQCHGWRPS